MKRHEEPRNPAPISPNQAELAGIDVDALDGVAGGCACGAAGCTTTQAPQQASVGNLAALLSAFPRR